MLKIFLKYSIYLSIFIGIINFFLSKYFCNLDQCVINEGISFGVSIGWEIYISLIITILIISLGIKSKRRCSSLLISIGVLGMSNLILRVIFGGVADYIHLFSLSFNIADIFIVLLSAIFIMIVIKDMIE